MAWKAIAEGLVAGGAAHEMAMVLMRRYARESALPRRSTGCWILRLHFGRKDGNLGERMDFLVRNILIHIPIGAGGRDLVDRSVENHRRPALYLACRLEKISNYF